MIAKNSRKIVLGLLAGSLLMLQASAGYAQEEAAAQEPKTNKLTTEEVIAVIRRKAEKVLQERRRANRLQFSGEASAGVGFERNPSLAASHKGDSFMEENLSLTLSKKLTPTLTWQGSYSGAYIDYLKLQQDSYTLQTLTPVKLSWRPGRMWRLEAGAD